VTKTKHCGVGDWELVEARIETNSAQKVSSQFSAISPEIMSSQSPEDYRSYYGKL
jgi:hypothetical protein